MARIETSKPQGFSEGYKPNAIKKFEISEFRDDSIKYSKDVCWIVSFKPEDSQYSERFWISGNFQRNTDNTLSADDKLIAKINNFLDFIGYAGGFNIKGEFEDPAGIIIPDFNIQAEISEHISQNYPISGYAYFYKEWKEKAGKAYTSIYPIYVKEDRIDWFRNYIQTQLNNKKIVPYIAEAPKPTPQSQHTYSSKPNAMKL